MNAWVQALRSRGWRIDVAKDRQPLPISTSARYPTLETSEVYTFLSHLTSCVSPDETAWFVCPPDLQGASESAFRWNEWELLSLAAADGNEEIEEEVRAFLDVHFPFLLSVKDGYEYFALCTAAGDGRIVQGREPEFETADVVAPSFGAFLNAFLLDTSIA